MRLVRWFKCKGSAWRVVRRPDRDGMVLEAWAVYKGGNVQPAIAQIAAADRTPIERMKAAVLSIVKGAE